MKNWILKQMLSYARPVSVRWTSGDGVRRVRMGWMDRTMGRRA
jgi:hypothetical protein